MKINTNTMSLKTQNALRQNQLKYETATERLSTGKRINGAADDAAGLAISTRMESKIRGQEVGVRNSNDAISLVQTTESALGSISNIMQRMRELAVQAANGTNTDADRASLDVEYQQLVEEVDHIATATTFNGVDLLAAVGTVNIQLSDVSGDTIAINTIEAGSGALAITGDLLDETKATAAMEAIDAALVKVSEQRAEYGANLNRLSFNVDNISSMSNNLAAAKSRIADADMSKEVSEMTKYKILTQTGISMLTKANENPQQITQLLQ